MTPEQRRLYVAATRIGRKFGIGGASWSVTRASGDGVDSPVTLAPAGTWAGYVCDEKPAALGQAAPGVAVGTKRWYAVGLAGSLQAGDVLTSVADPTIAFAVAASDLVVGYARYLVQPTSPASAAPATPQLVFSAAAGSQYLGAV